MSLLQNSNAISAPADTGFYPYQIANSIRGSASGNSTLKFTAGTPTSTTKMTMSFWVKRHTPDSTDAGANNVFTTGTGGGNYFYIAYNATLTMENTGGNQGTGYLLSEEKYRDPGAWYHVILRIDTSQSTQFDRIRVYVNGRQLGTSPSPDWRNQAMITNTAQDETFSYLNADGLVQAWGGLSGKGHGTEGADLSIADCMFFDGQSYYSELGEYKNGVWIPKDPSSLTFGNNGYWLKFTNSSNLGEDFSGNDNDFTVANFASHDQLLDSPTFGSSNGGNYCTLNPLFPDPTVARINDGMLAWGGSGGGGSVNEMGCMCTFAISPSDTNIYYFEGRMKTGHSGGIEQSIGVNVPTVDLTSDRGGRPTAWCITNTDYRRIYKGDNSYDQYSGSGSAGDIVGVEIDRANTTIKFYINGTLIGSATNLNTTTDLYPWVGTGGSTSSDLGWDLNFGQNGTFNGLATAQGEVDSSNLGNFYYDEANSCKALCAANLPVATEIDPAQTDDNYPQKLFGATIWTGDGTTSRAITGLGFRADLLWFKSRGSAFSHRIYDTTRGITSTGGYRLSSNTLGAQVDKTSSGQDISAVGTDGFTLGASSNLYTNDTNDGGLHVNWAWRANGGTTSSNSNGSVTSTVQVDPSGAFSIVTFRGGITNTGTGTVGHGLSKAPSMIIFKGYDNLGGGDGQWWVGNDALTSWNYFLRLNSNVAEIDKSGNGSMSAPTSTVFSINNTDGLGYSTIDTLAYCFANIEGYCKTGGYEGNGSTSGPFCFTGFRPSLVVTKRFDGSGSWLVHDNARNTYNETDKIVIWDDSGAEFSGANDKIDMLANGFVVRSSNTGINGSGSDYIYLAMAHNPFKYATGR
jgi:hypothetical protein